MIDLSVWRDDALVAPSQRDDFRFIGVRCDDPENLEAVLFFGSGEWNHGRRLSGMSDTAVSVNRTTLVSISPVRLHSALNMDEDDTPPGYDPDSNGHPPVGGGAAQL